jgi:hypothetical protein
LRDEKEASSDPIRSALSADEISDAVSIAAWKFDSCVDLKIAIARCAIVRTDMCERAFASHRIVRDEEIVFGDRTIDAASQPSFGSTILIVISNA